MTRIAMTGLDGGVVDVPQGAIDGLRLRVRGDLFGAGDPRWTEATGIWNGLARRTPALVLQPLGAADVAAAVAFARDYGVLISVKGGGHHIAGTALAEGGLTLDMSRMRDIAVDPHARRAHVGPGCRLRDVDGATAPHGLATVLGFVSDVGVAGLTLGGGLGYLTRRFGWTVDNLEAVEIVTADAAVRVASAQDDPDLFWAVRGGGGNLGAATRLTYRLHPVGPMVYGGLIAWPFDRAERVMDVYRELTAEAPRQLTVWLVLLCAPPAPFVPIEFRGRPVCAMVVCYSGRLEDAPRACAPLRALGAPMIDLLAERPYPQMQSLLDASEPAGWRYYWKTEYLRGLEPDLLATLRDAFARCPMPQAQVGVLHLGGAVNERAADDGAVGNRDARYAVGVNGMWAPDDDRGLTHTEWVRRTWADVRRFSTGGNYINFQTADEGQDRIRATYGQNLPRLLALKARYDPANLFRVNRNLDAARAGYAP